MKWHPDIPIGSVYVLHQLLPAIITLSISAPSGECSNFSAVEAIPTVQIFVHLVPITAGWTESVWIQCLAKALHMTSAAGIEPYNP